MERCFLVYQAGAEKKGIEGKLLFLSICRHHEYPLSIDALKMTNFHAKPNAFFQVEMCSKRIQIAAKFITAIEFFKLLFRRYLRQVFTETGKLRGVLGGGGNK